MFDTAASVSGTCFKRCCVRPGSAVLLLNSQAPSLQMLVVEHSGAMAEGLTAGLNVRQKATAHPCLYFTLCFDAVMLSNSFCQGKF